MRPRLVLLVSVLLLACQSNEPGLSPYAEESAAQRDTVRAQELNRQAADLLRSAPEEAEALLRGALAADLFFGPAHNNLGVLFLERGSLYEAANEFEWASKLMPGHPDPRLNLALTLERAGRVDDAIRACESALAVYPGHLPTEQQLAKLYIQMGQGPEELGGLLNRIALQGNSTAWRVWARQRQVKAREH